MLVFLTSVLTANFAFAGSGITYQGRILKSDGTALESPSVQFKIEVRTPGSENCLLYTETQTLDMSSTNGMFAVTINDGTATSVNTEPFTLDRAFQNRGTFSFAGGKCALGNNYSPNATDGRKLAVSFNDGNGWEVLPSQKVNFVPMAMESLTLGGYASGSMLRVNDGTGAPASIPALTWTQYNSFTDLLAGNSPSYLNSTSSLNGANISDGTIPDNKLASGITGSKISGNISGNAAGFTGSLAGDVTGTQGATVVAKIQGRSVDTAPPSNGQVLKWNQSANRWEASNDNTGASGTVMSVTGAAGSAITMTGTAADPVVGIADASTSAKGVVQLATSGQNAANVVVQGNDSRLSDSRAPNGSASGDLSGSYPSPTVAKIQGTAVSATAPTTGQFMKYGASSWAGSSINLSDLKSSVAGSLFNAPNCASNQTLSWSAVSDQFSCIAISLDASAITAGTMAVARLPVGTTTGTVAAGDDARFTNARTPTGSASGDLGGTYPSPSVVKIQGKDVATTAPAAGQVLTWNNTTSKWEPATPSSAPVSSVASKTGAVTLDYGDITNASSKYLSYKPNNVACNDGEVLKWDNTNSRWSCAADAGAAGTVASLTVNAPIVKTGTTSDPILSVSAASTSATGVVQLATSAQTTAGLAVQASDTRLSDSRAPNGTASGDLGGSYPSPTVAKIQGNAVANTAPTNGQVLAWNNTTSKWEPTTPNAGTVTSVTASAPLASSGGATPNLTITQASTSTNGYLTSTDWNTFNGKQNALGFTPVNKAGDTMTGALNLPSNGLTVGTNQLVVNGGNVGVGTASPAGTFEVKGGTAAASANGTTIKLVAQNGGSGNTNGGDIWLNPGTASGTGTAGGVGINVNWAPNAMLDVFNAPTATTGGVSSVLGETIYSPSAASTGGGVTSGQFSVTTAGTQSLANSNLAGSAGIVTHSINQPLNQATGAWGWVTHGGTNTITSAAGSNAYVQNSSTGTITTGAGVMANVLNSSTGTMTNAYGTNSTVQQTAAGTITNAMGVSAAVTKTAGTITNAYGVYIGSVQGTNNWGLYQAGSSPNYFQGNVGIGTTAPNALLDVNGTMRVSQICDSSGANCKTVSGGWGAGGSVTSVSGTSGLTGTVTTSGSLSLANIANNNLLANTSGSAGTPVATTLSGLIDSALTGSAQGNILYRGASGWAVLAPGTSGRFLKTQGAGADPVWAAGNAGTVTSVDMTVPSILSVSGGPVTSSGTLAVSLATQATNVVFAGPASGGAAAPTFRSLNINDIRSTNTGTFLTGTTCSAGQALVYSAVSDTISCSSISITSSQVTTALSYTPVNKAGDTMTGTLNLPSNGLAVGTNQLVVTGSSVGIGSTSPQGIIDVEGGTAGAGVSGKGIYLIAQSGGTGNTNGGDIRLSPGVKSGTGTAGVVTVGSWSAQSGFLFNVNGPAYSQSSGSTPGLWVDGQSGTGITASASGSAAYGIIASVGGGGKAISASATGGANSRGADVTATGATSVAVAGTGSGSGSIGVAGYSDGTAGYGIWAQNSASSGTPVALYATTPNLATGWAIYSAAGQNYFAGNVGIGTTGPTEALDIPNGDIRQRNFRMLTMVRTIPTTVGDEVDIGSFGMAAENLEISIVYSNANFAVVKHYLLPMNYGMTAGAWQIVAPISSTGPYGSDVDLDVNVNAGVAQLRLRRTSGTNAGDATITIKASGPLSNTFTASTATSSVTAPTTFVKTAVLTQVGSKVGIGTTNPTAKLEIAGTAGTDGIKFPDGTTQTTAYTGGGGGGTGFSNLQAFTSSGTFTVPAGITKVKVTVVGGGGGGSTAGYGGGGGGTSIKIVSGLTPGGTVAVTVGTGGAAGATGGTGVTSSFAAYATASGGAGATSTAPGAGGIGASGDLNLKGEGGRARACADVSSSNSSFCTSVYNSYGPYACYTGTAITAASCSAYVNGNGGDSYLGGGGLAASAGGAYGGGGGGAGGAGAAGVVIVEY